MFNTIVIAKPTIKTILRMTLMRFLHESGQISHSLNAGNSLRMVGGQDMDLTVLQLFIEVMRKGSFAAVARDRNVDPSSVSRAIARLEDDLGIRLLQRTTRRLVPTEAGAAYFGRIEHC